MLQEPTSGLQKLCQFATLSWLAIIKTKSIVAKYGTHEMKSIFFFKQIVSCNRIPFR